MIKVSAEDEKKEKLQEKKEKQESTVIYASVCHGNGGFCGFFGGL